MRGSNRFLRTEDNLLAENSSFFHFFPHNACQRTSVGFGDVCNTEQAGIQLVSGAQSHDQRDFQSSCCFQKIQLTADQIDGIHDIVITTALREENVPMGSIIQTVNGMENSVRIDIVDSIGNCLGFRHTDGGSQCLQLAVDVGYRNGIAVNQRQFSDSGAGQTFCHIAAHAAKAEQDYMGRGQSGLSILSPHHFIAEKTFIHADHS